MSASARCPHTNLDFDFHLTAMLDSNVGSLLLKAKCKNCGARMNLGRGLPMGASSRHPTLAGDTDGLGILIPVIGEGEEPDKEWGFAITRAVITDGA